jgi:hypothetical protein
MVRAETGKFHSPDGNTDCPDFSSLREMAGKARGHPEYR